MIALIIVASITTSAAATRAQVSMKVALRYQDAATAVAAEGSLEHQFRLAPGPVPQAALRSAEQTVRQAVGQLAHLGDASDRRLASAVLGEQRSYVAATASLLLAVDRHDSPAATAAIERRRVDPQLTVLADQLAPAVGSHQVLSSDAVESVHDRGQAALYLDIITLLAGVALVVAAGSLLRRYQRDLRSESEANRHLALYDTLTALPNRTLFQDRTTVALRAAARLGHEVAVMLLDLDRFKEVNDTLGHEHGDVLLAQVAERLTGTLRDMDSVARLGGDEFAVLLPVSGWQGARSAAQRVADALHPPFSVGDVTLDIEASIGIAVAEPGDDVGAVLRHADVAMYQAKSEHRSFARYEKASDDNSLSRLVLLGELRRAIVARQLILHYQPKIDARSGELKSVEALVRWQHPTRGLIAPDDFIPVAETTAVIHPLTTEVLRVALIQARRWADTGHPIPIAVNISVRSLADPSFPDQVHRLLQSHGVPAELLCLEVTETAVMTNPGRALSVLQALDARGIAISIDDFGTGYSSMTYLKSLPVRELKIDRSFVSGLTTDPGNVVIVRSTIDLGHNLGLSVVAEGVEDAKTETALRDLGCDLLQGYHVCRPVPVAQFDSWLAHRSPTVPLGVPS